ncbi:DAK2 domain-containing protein [Rhizobium puerariae]|uniref:DAK2 domain-containing protein n=1 Tax=Rhizobium puerariae TaxID=1585791 RepID=A0ABV6AMA0_9HYPH
MKAADSISMVEMFSEIAVAIDENRSVLSGKNQAEWEHGATMSAMFGAIETALAGLEPSEWSPGRYFDFAAETLLAMEGIEPRLYAAAFRRAGTTLLRRKRLGPEEFGLAFTAMASGIRDHAGNQPRDQVIADVWEKAAAAYLDASKRDLPLADCLQAAAAAARGLASTTEHGRPFALSASLIIRAMHDALK